MEKDAREILESLLAISVPAKTRFWRSKDGWQFHYTTEPVGGKFYALAYKPIGKGARSGKPRTCKLVKKVAFARRKTAKARAYKWFVARKDK